MKDFLSQLTSYHFLNHLLPGAIFCIVGTKFTNFQMVQENLISAFFVYYFVGLTLCRVGSLVVEPIVDWHTQIKGSSYSQFVEAAAKDSKIDVLVEINNLYRTLIVIPFILAGMKIYEAAVSRFIWLDDLGPYLLGLLISIIFYLSHIKQTKYVSKRVKANL